MRYFFRIFILCMLLMSSGLAYAELSSAAKAFIAKTNIQGIKQQNKQLVLNTDLPANNTTIEWIYLIHNTSAKTVYLDHPADHPGTPSAGWSSTLDAKQWSALMLAKPGFALTCATDNTLNPPVYSACGKLLKAYRMQSQSLNGSKQGSYWISENEPLHRLIKDMQIRGVIAN